MIKKTSIIIALFAISFNSCQKDFLDINEDPSKAIDVPPRLLLPTIQSHIAFAQGGDAARITGVFMQHYTGAARQFAQYQIYNVSPSDVDNLWRFNLYGGPLKDLELLEKKSTENNYVHYKGCSKILMAYALGLTTDLWGDIPYSEAFQATDNLQPKFDSQQSIYATIIKLLDEGIAAVNSSNGTALAPGTDDLLFGGDMASWDKFAHSLKARFYLHLVKVDPANAALALTEVPLGITATADNASFYFGLTETTSNPFYQYDQERGDISYSGNLISYMVSTGDPRLDEYADTSSPEVMGAFFGSIDSPVDFMTYTELKFIEAEASFRTNDLIRAAAAYNEAVKSSILRINGSADSLFEAQYANDSSSTITLDKIMTQKYVAMYSNPESWTDWRRTNIPNLTPTDGVAIPRSFWYPESEVNYNSNTPANTSLLRKVWWDL